MFSYCRFKKVLYVCSVKQLNIYTMTTSITTTKLRNGVTVLAKVDRYGINAVGYTNLKQANARQIKLSLEGINCSVYRTPCNQMVTYIKINN